MRETELFLAVARVTFLSAREKGILLKNLDNIKGLRLLSIEDICAIVGRRIRARSWDPDDIERSVDRDIAALSRYGIGWTSIENADYPPALREIYDPPFVVFWRGDLPDPEQGAVAIVGTRMPTGTGAELAYRLGREFGEAGIAVVSGLARGIDAAAHRGNVDALARSVAVIASGPDRVYPRCNARLAERLLDGGGCILSEYPPGAEPLAWRFPARNRLIAGLARSVVVVEAPERSGALITASFALDEGRDLYVGADCLGSTRAAGTRSLAESGARAVKSAREVVADWYCAERRVAGRWPKGARRGRQLALDFENEMNA